MRDIDTLSELYNDALMADAEAVEKGLERPEEVIELLEFVASRMGRIIAALRAAETLYYALEPGSNDRYQVMSDDAVWELRDALNALDSPVVAAE